MCLEYSNGQDVICIIMYRSFSSIIAELSKLLRCRTKNKTRIQIGQMYVDKIGEGFCK